MHFFHLHLYFQGQETLLDYDSQKLPVYKYHPHDNLVSEKVALLLLNHQAWSWPSTNDLCLKNCCNQLGH